jgi:hypothetical protein
VKSGGRTELILNDLFRPFPAFFQTGKGIKIKGCNAPSFKTGKTLQGKDTLK